MIALTQLVKETNQLLEIDQYRDYCPNGLQVEGKAEVQSILSGVTASQALIDTAIEKGVDLVLVHHGFFWKGENETITGIKKKRLKSLLDHDISLVAYHLPLDGHETLGNNSQLAKLWGVDIAGRFGSGPNGGIGIYAELDEPVPVDVMQRMVSESLGREALLFNGKSQQIKRFGWCSGAAQGYINEAAELELDLFISGEVSESTYHFAKEAGIHYLAAGHHATERLGVSALGDYLANRYQIDHQFIDLYNPV